METKTKRKAGRISNEVKAHTKPASREHYRKLAEYCTTAIINRAVYVIVTLPRWAKFKKGFPRPLKIINGGDSLIDTYHLSATMTLDWLHKNKYAKYDAKSLKDAIGRMEKTFAVTGRHFDEKYDLGSEEEYEE